MAGFYLWETASLTLRISGEDNPLDGYEHIVVSVAQAGYAPLNISEDALSIDPEESTITVRLTQEQTGMFREGKAQVQVNIYYSDTERDTTAKGTIEVRDNLYKRVMP